MEKGKFNVSIVWVIHLCLNKFWWSTRDLELIAMPADGAGNEKADSGIWIGVNNQGHRFLGWVRSSEMLWACPLRIFPWSSVEVYVFCISPGWERSLSKVCNPLCRSEEVTAPVINVDESWESVPQAIKAFCTALNAEGKWEEAMSVRCKYCSTSPFVGW